MGRATAMSAQTCLTRISADIMKFDGDIRSETALIMISVRDGTARGRRGEGWGTHALACRCGSVVRVRLGPHHGSRGTSVVSSLRSWDSMAYDDAPSLPASGSTLSAFTALLRGRGSRRWQIRGTIQHVHTQWPAQWWELKHTQNSHTAWYSSGNRSAPGKRKDTRLKGKVEGHAVILQDR
ncbi:hypothetical protein BJV74DRAFT_580505 [Russula compacta]|nr:hypothetical protein BJV74DRAFT_580505 [Russula compacta]